MTYRLCMALFEQWRLQAASISYKIIFRPAVPNNPFVIIVVMDLLEAVAEATSHLTTNQSTLAGASTCAETKLAVRHYVTSARRRRSEWTLAVVSSSLDCRILLLVFCNGIKPIYFRWPCAVCA
jgi:hypothetical protein